MSGPQQKYSITELELLSIVETLKEFKGILFGQRVEVFTEHINVTRDPLGITSGRLYRWRLQIEEYDPDIMYIKGLDNMMAGVLSRLTKIQIKTVIQMAKIQMSTAVKKNGIISSRYAITMMKNQVTNQMKTTNIIIVKHLQIT